MARLTGFHPVAIPGINTPFPPARARSVSVPLLIERHGGPEGAPTS